MPDYQLSDQVLQYSFNGWPSEEAMAEIRAFLADRHKEVMASYDKNWVKTPKFPTVKDLISREAKATSDYLENHTSCPSCLCNEVTVTTIGGNWSESHPSPNKAKCKCGWCGTEHQLVPA